MNYQIMRSKRRSIGLQITKQAELVVRAPFFVSERMIEQVIREKSKWIERTQARIRASAAFASPKKFEEGERFSFLGETYSLKFVDGAKERLELNETFDLAREFIKWAPDIFETWYRKRAIHYLEPLVQEHAARLDVRYKKIKINGSQGRWGSCSADGNLNFTWRLMMAPRDVIRYVAAHEVAHLKEQNHSARFWKVVAFLDPDYRKQEIWLKKHGNQLSLD